MEQERDKAWTAEDERLVVDDDSDVVPAGEKPAVPDVDIPIEAPEADVLEQEQAVAGLDEEEER